MREDIESIIKTRLFTSGINSVLIHSDLQKGFSVPFDRNNRNAFVVEHFNKLAELFEGVEIYMPSFNYDFLSKKIYDLQKSPSQVGALTEFYRKKNETWRTKDPVFSFSGSGEKTFDDRDYDTCTIDPFDATSFFKYLYDSNAFLFHYGSEFKHSTIIHFIERKLGSVPYRYDKLFTGGVIDNNSKFNVRYKYHVRPWRKYLEYDWDKLIKELTVADILYSYKNERTEICFCNIKTMADFILTQLMDDALYLLDKKSKEWIVPALDRLGRNFLMEDFESI